MTTPILSIHNLIVAFRSYEQASSFWHAKQTDIPVLQDFSLELFEGEILALVGASGSGKTVLANAILGLHERGVVTDGSISFEGRLQTRTALAKLRGNQIAYVPQRVSYLDPRMKVGAQVVGDLSGYPRDQRSSVRKQRTRRMHELFEVYNLKVDVAQMYPHELSGGMARRVLLICALMDKPRVLIADEPTPGLDEDQALQAMDDLRAFSDTGGSVLFITHDLGLAIKAADRIAVCKDGHIVDAASSKDFETPQCLSHPFSQALVRSMPEYTGEDSAWSIESIGKSLAVHEKQVSAQNVDIEKPLLSIENLSFSYPAAKNVLQNISFKLNVGERLAVISPSGRGKTTLCRLLAGHLKMQEGAVQLEDFISESSSRSVQQAGEPRAHSIWCAHPIQLVSQHPELAFDPRIRIKTSLSEAGDLSSPWAKVLMKSFGVASSWLSRFPSELSSGELTRVSIVRALMTSPQVLILDEATAMLDTVSQANIWQSLIKLQEQEGFALLFTSHSQPLVQRVATRVFKL